jgi:hypothetical protein
MKFHITIKRNKSEYVAQAKWRVQCTCGHKPPPFNTYAAARREAMYHIDEHQDRLNEKIGKSNSYGIDDPYMEPPC